MKRTFGLLAAAVGMAVLILDPRTAFLGATEGITLCIRSVIPSLFPFFVLSVWITGTLGSSPVALPKSLRRVLGIPMGAESLLMLGFFGGYPVGAQNVAQLHDQGQLSRDSARRLLMFCSNAGPAFLFGIVGPQFSAAWMAWCLWGILVVSALLVAELIPGSPTEKLTLLPQNMRLAQAVNRSVGNMARVCGWVVLMRIVTVYLDKWLLSDWPKILRITLHGILELTSGCCDLQEIGQESLRFVVAAGLLSWGGVCVLCQTASVTGSLGTDSYCKGKLLQTLFSLVLASLIAGLCIR